MSAPRNSIWDIAGILLLGAVLWAVFRGVLDGGGPAPVPVGTPRPPLMVEGWLNFAPGERFSAEGQVLVVDCWATWCGPCLAALPEMADLAARYQPLGVKFVGVTAESSEAIRAIEGVVDRTPGFNWPVAYGGEEFLNALNVHEIPTVIVFGRDGRCRYSTVGGGAGRQIEEALDAALAEREAAPIDTASL